jgi:AcrR family transcriptional regulator
MGKIETRRKILEGAFECFSASDFHDVKIIDIARQAGVGKGTVYEYFESKEVLYQQLFEYILDTYLQQMREATVLEIPVKERLIAIYETQIRLSEEMRARVKGLRLMEKIWSLKKDRPFQDIGESIMELFGQLIEKGIEDGSIRKDVPKQELQRLLAIGLPVLCHGPFEEDMDPRGRATQYVEMLFAGIGAGN